MGINNIDERSNVISVTELNNLISAVIQSEPVFENIWVTGEISNWVVASSGHAYFSIKDANAAISCAMWKGSRAKVRDVNLKSGTQIKCRGRVEYYKPNGKLQLIVDLVLPAGEGALYAEFTRIKAELEAEGLFDADRKMDIPPFPKNIGVVTSGSGAALQDIINTLSRRLPLAKLWLSPTLVQGVDAPANIVKALNKLITFGLPDVIIVARGGGSIEDLWAFNDERVARAIADCPIPVITGVGHETDTTIVDFVSDLRAPTPTAAAERASMISVDDLRSNLLYYQDSINNAVNNEVNIRRQRLENLGQNLRLLNPNRKLNIEIQRLDIIANGLARNIQSVLDRKKNTLEAYERHLSALNPKEVLRRGYAIVQRAGSKDVVKNSESVAVGEELEITLYQGKVEVRVQNRTQE